MPRGETMSNMLGGRNLALITSRMTKGETFQHVQATRTISEAIVMSPKTSNNGFIFPLYLLAESANPGKLSFRKEPDLNLSASCLRAFAQTLDLPLTKPFGLPKDITPEDIFHYVYAVLYSSGYRSRYAEFLKIDFPRLPLTGNLELFRALARLGDELVALQLLESDKLVQTISEFVGNRTVEVEKVSWSHDTVWTDRAQTSGFSGVGEPIWKFHLGGYQVCEKWLKDRKGRTLSKGDIAHYHKIVVAITETIKVMQEIDELIDAHGGWPGAFRSTATAPAAAARVVEITAQPSI
jgi:predicted helicase